MSSLHLRVGIVTESVKLAITTRDPSGFETLADAGDYPHRGRLSPDAFTRPGSVDRSRRACVGTVSLGGAFAVAIFVAGCDSEAKSGETGIRDGAAVDSGRFPQTRFCDLPGSVQYTAGGVVTMPAGAAPPPNLAFLTLPRGFCAHEFAAVGNTRQLRFAPSGELFVASPTKRTTGGGPQGRSAIVVLADDDGDGFADAPSTFLAHLPATQGLLFANGHLYYQDDVRIMRVAYRDGDRVAVGQPSLVAEIQHYVSTLHWPKTLDQADDGTIYVTNGDDDTLGCEGPVPFRGGVLKLDGSNTAQPVAKGFRNPTALRCLRGKNLCFAVELSRDYSGPRGGREKIVPIREGDDWGFPCCATQNLPFADFPRAECGGVTPEDVSFLIGDTPFDIDFEPGKWPAPYTGSAFVPLHGAVETWAGGRVVASAVEPSAGWLKAATDVDGANMGAMLDFATGWDDGRFLQGRPARVAFARDGRLFLGNDSNGQIVWIAPRELERTPKP
jgi:glucose/arabinose dehydrogenase